MGQAEIAFHSIRAERSVSSAFVSGVKLETETGWRAVEDLIPGLHVHTLDGGLRRIVDMRVLSLAAGCNDYYADGLTLIPGGVLGNCDAFYALPDQEILLRDKEVSDIAVSASALIRAQCLEGYRGITRTLPVDQIALIMLCFSETEVVWANTGVLMHCPGRRSSHSYFPRLTPEQSLRLVSRMIARDETERLPSAA